MQNFYLFPKLFLTKILFFHVSFKHQDWQRDTSSAFGEVALYKNQRLADSPVGELTSPSPRPEAPSHGSCGGSDDVFEAVGGVAGQRRASAPAAQVLAVRPLHVDVPLLLLAAAASLRTTLSVCVVWITPNEIRLNTNRR